MDLTVNEVQTITQLLERANKFIVAEEKEKMKDHDPDPTLGGN